MIGRKKRWTSQQKMEALENSEINFQIACFYDSDWSWKLGDEMNGYKEEGGALYSLTECVDELWEFAKKFYPDAECFK